MSNRFLTAAEAAAELGISLPTLYAYVSRGLLRSQPGEGGSRARRYPAEEVERLKERALQRRDPRRAAAEALDWGAPVLESALTLIQEGRLYYRGHAAVRLARERTFEEVAALLWTGAPGRAAGLFPRTPLPLPEAVVHLLPRVEGLLPVARVQAVLPVLAAEDPGAYGLRSAAVVGSGARLLRWVAAVVGGVEVADGSVVETLCRGWQAGPEAAALVNTALVLCADHELNASSFTARCVAGAGGTVYGAVGAGLAALQGIRHGGVTEQVETFFREVGTASEAGRAVGSRLRRGEGIPGFGHRLYPEGDPRARLLLSLVRAALPDSPVVGLAGAIAGEVLRVLDLHPTIDFALVTLSLALGLPEGAPLSLFAGGRTAGLIAHAIEQYGTDRLIRPRAQYVGPRPEPGEHG